MAQGKPDADPKMTRRQAENARSAIQTGVLLKLLHDNAIGAVELSQSRVKSIQILLSKVLPDMQQIEQVEPEQPRAIGDIRAQLLELVKADPDLLAYLNQAAVTGTVPPNGPDLHVVK